MSTDPPTANARPTFNGDLKPSEFFWRDHQQWLETHGYMLPSRYRPGWVPSWKETNKPYFSCEDGQSYIRGHVVDAIRVSDGKVVMLKRTSRLTHPHEVEISQMFSSPELASEPRNHCVPVYDVIQTTDDENTSILVLPLLRGYNDPSLYTVGEVIEFLHQIFEGLQFMHQHHVAHRDCMKLNIMMDPSAIYPDLYHPRAPLRTRDFQGWVEPFTRTERPTKYYLIDFGLSVKFDPDDTNPAVLPIKGGDKTVPEFQHDESYKKDQNPFPTDIYYLGNLIRQDFLQRYSGLDFLASLVADMVQDDPTKRPTIDEVVSRFAELRSKLSYWKLRGRLVKRTERIGLRRFLKNIRHLYRTTKFILWRYRAIPTPAS
ncbi:kinase-like domain-containing protein [Amylocystis lapponica]|nr:kinase-like domain-containing protein [Amylocystis lapponica]